jgi:dTDP-4-amino-4,6-dideoxygalactose transaminase
MNDISATIGLVNIEETDKVLSKHIDNANYYNEQLKDIPGITLLENKPDRQGAYWIYTMKVKNRDDFMLKMKEKGIMTSRVHERNDLNSCVEEFRVHLPNIEQLVKEMVSIPCGWWVTEEDRAYIVNCIKGGW